MDDFISRQAAIDAIANCTNCGDEKTLRAYVAKHNLDNEWSGGVLEAINAVEDLPSAQPEQRWISCSERLPSKADHTDDMVLVCYRNGSVRFDTYMSGWVQGNPVAWMPLPEPYWEGRWEE